MSLNRGSAQHLRANRRIAQRLADPAGHLAGQAHHEAAVADRPADQLRALLERRGERAGNGEALRLGGDQGRGGAVAELKHRQQRLDSALVLEVEGRKLDGDDQNPGGGLGADDMVSEAERRNRGVAAHESDQGPLDIPRQAELGGDHLVDSRSDEAGATRDDEMGDSGEIGGIAKPRDGVEGQLRRGFAIDPHSRGGGRKPAMIESARLDRRAAGRGRRKHRPAMLDPRAFGHPVEHFASARIPDPALRPVDEGAVHVVAGHLLADGVDVGTKRGKAPRPRTRCYCRAL